MKKLTTALSLTGAVLLSASAFAQTDSWNLSRDMMSGPVWPFTSNPTAATAPATGVWSFAKLAAPYATYELLTDYKFPCRPANNTPGTLACWENPATIRPTVAVSPWNPTREFSGATDYNVIQGMVHLHPDTNARAVISWRSPIAGDVRIFGRVADLDAACGDGVQWRILKAQGPYPIAATSAIPEPSSNFLWGNTGVTNWATVRNPAILGEPKSQSFAVISANVTVGTEILFEFDKKGDAGCDSTSFDVLISRI